MSAIKKKFADFIIRLSKDLAVPVLLPQVQLLNAHMLQLGLDEQLYIYGQQIGVEIARMAGAKMGKPLMTLEELVDWSPFIVKHLTMGYATAEVVDVDYAKGRYVIRVFNSPYARLPDGKIVERGKPACYLLAGIFAGGVSKLLQRPYRVEEVKCVAKGDPYCEFHIIPV